MPKTHLLREPGAEKILGLVGLFTGSDPVVLSLIVVDIDGGTEFNVISHGQKYNAAMVKVVSREFENVLVETNHCQGLRTVIRSYNHSANIYSH